MKDLAVMDPAQTFSSAIKARFSDAPPYSNILTGIGEFVATYYATNQAEKLPAFTHDANTYEASGITEVQELQDLMISLYRVSALSAWWSSNGDQFFSAWGNLIGIPDVENEWPADSLEGKLQTLENAIAGSDWTRLQNIWQRPRKLAETGKP